MTVCVKGCQFGGTIEKCTLLNRGMACATTERCGACFNEVQGDQLANGICRRCLADDDQVSPPVSYGDRYPPAPQGRGRC